MQSRGVVGSVNIIILISAFCTRGMIHINLDQSFELYCSFVGTQAIRIVKVEVKLRGVQWNYDILNNILKIYIYRSMTLE